MADESLLRLLQQRNKAGDLDAIPVQQEDTRPFLKRLGDWLSEAGGNYAQAARTGGWQDPQPGQRGAWVPSRINEQGQPELAFPAIPQDAAYSAASVTKDALEGRLVDAVHSGDRDFLDDYSRRSFDVASMLPAAGVAATRMRPRGTVPDRAPDPAPTPQPREYSTGPEQIVPDHVYGTPPYQPEWPYITRPALGQELFDLDPRGIHPAEAGAPGARVLKYQDMPARMKTVGQDPVPGVRGMDGRPVYSNPDDPNTAAILAVLSGRGEKPRALPQVEQTWGPKWDILMGQQYRMAEAGGDLSTQYDILKAKLSKASGIDPEMRAAMEAKAQELAAEMGVEGRKAAGISANPDDPNTAAILAAMQGQDKPKGITAYHGSPHDFDRFDMSKIGTGEGAQAYGHGLYFAENEGVARSYRDPHSSNVFKYDGVPAGHNWQTAPLEYLDQKTATTKGVDVALADAIQRLKKQAEFHRTTYENGDPAPNLYDGAVARLEKLDPSKIQPPGRMYEVRINADPADFLDWDKPLAEQPQRFRDLVAKDGYSAERIFKDNKPFGESGYIARNESGYPTQQRLKQAGIPGIKYLDQGSRTAGEGSRNYVVFDDALVEIMRKYANAPDPTTAAILALLTAQQGGPPQQ